MVARSRLVWRLGVGNDPHRKASRKDFRNGKTDSIDGDRTLGSHIMPGVFRQFDFESEVCAFSIEGDEWARRNQRDLERNVRLRGRPRVTRAPDLRDYPAANCGG